MRGPVKRWRRRQWRDWWSTDYARTLKAAGADCGLVPMGPRGWRRGETPDEFVERVAILAPARLAGKQRRG